MKLNRSRRPPSHVRWRKNERGVYCMRVHVWIDDCGRVVQPPRNPQHPLLTLPAPPPVPPTPVATPRTAVSVAPTPSIGSATAGTPSGFSPATSFASAVSGVRVDARPALAGSASASLPSAMNAPAASSPLVTSAPRMRAGGDALAASANAPAFVPGALQVPSLSSPTQLSGLAPEYMPSGTTTARSSASALALTAPEFTPAGVAPSATPAATTAVPESLLAAAAAAAHGGDYRIIVRGILLPPNEPTRTAATTADVIGNWFYDRGVCPVDVLVPTAAGGLLAPTFDGTAILLFINASSAERAIALAGQRITPNVAPWPKLSLEQYHPVSLPIATGRFTAVSSSSPASNTSAPVSPKSGDIVQASSGSGVWAAAAAKVPATASSAGGSAVARVLQTGVTPPMSPSRATQTTAPNTPSSAPAARYALAARVGASQADDEMCVEYPCEHV